MCGTYTQRVSKRRSWNLMILIYFFAIKQRRTNKVFATYSSLDLGYIANHPSQIYTCIPTVYYHIHRSHILDNVRTAYSSIRSIRICICIRPVANRNRALSNSLRSKPVPYRIYRSSRAGIRVRRSPLRTCSDRTNRLSACTGSYTGHRSSSAHRSLGTSRRAPCSWIVDICP